MSASTLSAPAGAAPLRQDLRTIGVVGLAHATSHFFHMLLPPLFPLLVRDFGLTYAQLGGLVTLFFAISAVGQALSGFLVDRVGARPVLFAALALFVLSAAAGSMAQGFGGLMLAAALAGLGNAPFHPADFTILNQRVSVPRLGHAFSAHSISGNLGWAIAPVFMLGITAASGSWRVAMAAAGVWAACVLLLVFVRRADLDDRAGARASLPAPGVVSLPSVAANVAEHPLAFLRLRAVWLCFSFFFWSTAALAAIQSFASPAMQSIYGLPLSTTSFVVTGYMLCGAAGMVAGGFLATRVQRLERVIGLCLAASAVLLALVGSGLLPATLALALAALAGAGTGLAGPSRDMLIKRAAPPGATGRVYGTVYSGLDLGFAVAAPVFGFVLDRGWPAGVFHGAALALLLGVGSATLVGASVSARQRLRPAKMAL